MTEIENIVAVLGQEKVSALLHTILPHITSRSHILLESLRAQDWDHAAQIAHKILSTANLFASKPLLQNLIAIERGDLNLLQQASFSQTLAHQLESSISYLDTFHKH